MYIYVYIEREIDHISACMHGWMDGWVAGWMDGWMDLGLSFLLVKSVQPYRHSS